MKLAIFFFVIAVLGILHQGLFCGEWFNWSQLWHHEPLIAVALAVGAGILLGRKVVDGQ